MIAGIFEFVFGNFTLTFFVIGLIVSIIVLAVHRAWTSFRMAEEFLNWFLFFTVGVSFAYNFIFHSVFGDFSAEVIGWAQSPFQLEVAWASLGFAVIGFMAFPRRSPFLLKVAAIVGVSVFLLGDAGGHVYQMVTANNFAPGNAGVVFYSDILLPIIGVILLVWYGRARSRSRSREVPTAL